MIANCQHWWNRNVLPGNQKCTVTVTGEYAHVESESVMMSMTSGSASGSDLALFGSNIWVLLVLQVPDGHGSTSANASLEFFLFFSDATDLYCIIPWRNYLVNSSMIILCAVWEHLVCNPNQHINVCNGPKRALFAIKFIYEWFPSNSLGMKWASDLHNNA